MYPTTPRRCASSSIALFRTTSPTPASSRPRAQAASKELPLPYAMTNCRDEPLRRRRHDQRGLDHVCDGLCCRKEVRRHLCARRRNQSVIHSYAREALAACGEHDHLAPTAAPAMARLAPWALAKAAPEACEAGSSRTPTMCLPLEVVLVYLTGAPKKGIGPHDVALALVAATFDSGFVKNKVLEFVGPRRCEPARRIPQRHRRYDHRDHLPLLHLGDGRSGA